MRRDIFRLVIFFIPVLAFMVVLDSLVTKGMKRTHATDFNEWNAVFSGSIKADLLISGSSRAFVHYSPAILDSVLHVNSYNLGVNGQKFIIQLCRIETCLKYSAKPKIIIQDIDKSTLCKDTALYKPITFLPYLSEPLVWEATSRYHGLSFPDYYLPLLKYRGYNDWIKHGLSEYFVANPRHDTLKYKGYTGQQRKWDGKWDQFKKRNPKGTRIHPDNETCLLFEEFIKRCNKDGIRLILVHSPELYESRKYFHNRDSIISLYKQWANEYGLDFLDYSEDTLCHQQQYFYNASHLNKEGSELFTRKLAHDLREMLNKE